MISYSQNFEDVVLNRVFHSVDSGRYVDIGAYHPVVDSVTKHFYDIGWSGVNIEPVKRFWETFQTNRPRDKNLNIVVGAYEGDVTFHQYGDSGLSGYRDLPDSQALEALELDETTKNLPMTTLAQISKDLNLSEVEFLKIDVEGAERDVMLGADFTIFRPMVIVVEAIKPKLPGCDLYSIEPNWQQFEEILFDNDYEFGLFDGLNRFYYRKENPELSEPLSYPANITDGFKLHKNHTLIPESTYEKKPKRWKKMLKTYLNRIKDAISKFIKEE